MSEVAGWIIFFLIIILIYGGMHFYVFSKAQSAFHFNARTGSAIAIFMTLMVFSIFIGHLVERAGSTFFASLILHLAYIWLGLIFIFFWGSLLVDLYRLAVFAAGFLSGRDLAIAMPSHKLAFFIPLTLSIVLSVYGYYEGKNKISI